MTHKVSSWTKLKKIENGGFGVEFDISTAPSSVLVLPHRTDLGYIHSTKKVE